MARQLNIYLPQQQADYSLHMQGFCWDRSINCRKPNLYCHEKSKQNCYNLTDKLITGYSISNLVWMVEDEKEQQHHQTDECQKDWNKTKYPKWNRNPTEKEVRRCYRKAICFSSPCSCLENLVFKDPTLQFSQYNNKLCHIFGSLTEQEKLLRGSSDNFNRNCWWLLKK